MCHQVDVHEENMAFKLCRTIELNQTDIPLTGKDSPSCQDVRLEDYRIDAARCAAISWTP